MKIKFDVTHKELNIIQDIFAKHLCDDCNVWVFGSRAKNTALFNSDLDLAIECKDKMDLNKLNKIKSALEFSRLPYTVDLIDINAIKPHFKDLIHSEMIAFPLNKNSNIPKLRFSEFSGGWEEKKLGNIATFYNSKRVPLTESDRIAGKYPYYGASGVIDYVKEYLFDGEYILLGEDGANIVMRNSRLVFLAKGRFWVNNHAHIFQAKDSNVFLCEALERINYTKYNTGTAQPKLNSDVVKKITLALPTNPEQTKIASFLTSVDKKIELLTQKEKLLKDYKKGIMQKIFSQEIRFKADDGSEFPEWIEKKLGDVCSITTGNSNREDSSLDGEYTFFDRSEDIRTSNIYLFDGDAVIVAGEGQIFIPKYFIGKFDLHQRTYAIMDFIDTCGKFIYYKIYVSQNYFLSQAVGSTVKSLRLPMFKKMLINLPSLQEQTKIANFLSAIDSKIEQVTIQLEHTKEFKKGLLQQMFV